MTDSLREPASPPSQPLPASAPDGVYGLAFENAPLGIALVGLDGSFLEVNRIFCQLLGYSREELLRTTFRAITHPEDLAQSDHLVQNLLNRTQDNFALEKRYLCKDASVLWARVHARLLRDAAGAPICLIAHLQDISVRRSIERNLIRSNRLYTVLSQTNDAVIRIRDRQTLFDRVCRIAVEAGGFRMAWIGIADLAAKVLRPVAFAGAARGYLNRIVISTEEGDPTGTGPSGCAYRNGAYDVCNNIEREPRMEAWRQESLSRGFRSNASFALRQGGRVVGVMTFLADETNFFNAEEIHLISELTANLSFALENMELEAKREEAEAELQSLFVSSPAGLVILDEDLRFVRLNEEMARVAGLPAASQVGRRLEEVLPDQAPALSAICRRILETGEPVLNQEISGRADSEAAGERHWIASFFPVQGRRNRRTKFLGGVLVEVTGRMRAEEALRESEQRFRTLFSSLPLGVVIIDPETERPIQFNEAVCAQLGYTREEFAGLRIQDWQPELSPESQGSFAQEALNWKQGTRETLQVTKTGELRNVLVEIRVVQLEGKPVLSCIFQDITERRQSENERKRLEEQLHQNQKIETLGRLAGGVAHDFNNLLVPMMGYAELALLKLPPDSPLRDDLQQIRVAAERASGLTRQLLAFSRKQVLEVRVLNLNQAVTEASALLRRLIGENIRVALDLDPEPCWVRGDSGQVQQIIMNLAVNARDAMPDGGQLTLVTRRQEDHPLIGVSVRLIVSDTGMGMSPDALGHLFEPFFTTKALGKGTGLGLATVYGIVKQHGGHIQVASQPGRGTTFTIDLPQAEAEAAPSGAAGGLEETAPAGGTLMVVEDETVVRHFIHGILNNQGYRILAAAGPEEALKLQADLAEPVDLLITDVIMPGMNGRELYERLAKKQPGLRVLFISGYTDDIIAQEGLEQSTLYFLQKPFTLKQLVEKVKEALQG